MFDPSLWQSLQFQDVEVVPIAQRRLITMTIPLQTVVALTTVAVVNGDTADKTYDLQWKPGTLTVAANVISRIVTTLAARSLLPEMPDAPADPKFQGPLLFQGPGVLTLVPQSFMAAATVMQANLHWFQAKFDGKASDPIVPVGTDI